MNVVIGYWIWFAYFIIILSFVFQENGNYSITLISMPKPLSGPQTTKRRKPGTRVKSGNAFQCNGVMLDPQSKEIGTGTGFQKRATRLVLGSDVFCSSQPTYPGNAANVLARRGPWQLRGA